MSAPTFRVISIGTLASHPLWDEKRDARTGHATTTLVSVDDTHVLVDPGLPGPMLQARLSERTKVRPEEISHVFVTSFTGDHIRGLEHFGHASWLLHAPEREHADAALREEHDRVRELGDGELVDRVEWQLRVLRRCAEPDDHVAPGVDLFPLPGVTPGTCGLLLALPRSTILIAGDAVATIEHLEQGKVLPTCLDIEQAQESFREAIEIADVIVPGRDNVVYNPLRA